MAKKSTKSKSTSRSLFRQEDFGKWNFVIFLTLAFILLVIVVKAMTGVSQDVRTKAGLTCPEINLPRAEDCGGGWTYKRDINGCLAFFCETKQETKTQ